jgi:hypothetical protein
VGGSVNRTRATLFLIAFSVIGILEIIEGITDGWTAINWLSLAVSIFFGVQSAYFLSKSDTPQA